MRFSISVLCLLLPLSVGAAEPAAQPKSQSASFNPDISLILSGSAAHLGNDPDAYAIPGFMLGAETGPGTRGLSLGESELIVSANVDDLFYGQFTAALTPENETEIEEAFFETFALGGGFTVHGGRFLSV